MNVVMYSFLTVFLFIVSSVNSQTVSVDISNTPNQLVDILMDASCDARSNQRVSSSQSVGYFNNNSSNFPINEGVIIRNGNALLSQGAYTGLGLSSQVTTASDSDLQTISNNLGQVSTIVDVGYLEFDFVPSGNHFGFDFLFASNEYGEWQCGFSDVFAFILTNLDTGETTNLAVVPGTTNSISSVRDIRDNTYNSSCNSVNSDLFSTYNVDDPTSSSLNMRGYTILMNASTGVIPGNNYRIKLAIGDYNDSDFDSAIFIAAGSLETSVNLGDDVTICNSENITLDTEINDTINYLFVWRRDGAILTGENNPTLITDQPGIYDVTVTTNGCVLTDQVTISNLQLTTPQNLTACDNGANTFFDLTINNEASVNLDSTIFELMYYSSLTNAINNVPIPNSDLNNYQSSGGQIIYVRARNRLTNVVCSSRAEFELIALNVVATDPNDFNVCENAGSIHIPNNVQNQILNGLNMAEYSIVYYESMADAASNMNAIINETNYPVPAVNTPLWARLVSNANSDCYDIVDFMINIAAVAPVDALPDVTVCDNYTLPSLTNGGYFSQSGGNGTSYNSGDVISSSSLIYIYNTNADGCSNETSFNVQVSQSYTIETDHCAQFVLPTPPIGSFFTGPNGSGIELPPGTTITSNQRIYYFSEFNGVPCADIPFDITIHTPPPVDTSPNIISCNNYVLPPLTDGNYFTGQNGTGLALFPGDELTSIFDFIFIYNDDGRCTSQSVFRVTILDIADFPDVTTCGSYTLPQILTGQGGYFTAPGGNGMELPVGTILSTSQTVYYYVETTNGNNCTTNLSFEVTILPAPPISDHFTDIVRCVDEPYELETIQFGSYYTQPNGQGIQLNAGDIISTSQTIYVYDTNGVCSSEHSFDVEIRPLPQIDAFTDIFVCDPYTLPVLTNGNYFTAPNGQGTQLNAGDIISTTQTLYVYNEYPDLTTCSSENVFTVNIVGITVDQLEDVSICNNYTLPPLTVGEYFTEAFGQGTQLFPGDIITSTQTLFIYAEGGDRVTCFDNHEFTVTIINLPSSQNFQNQEVCESFTLETFNIPDVTVTYYRQPNAVNEIAPADFTLTEPGIYTIHVRLVNDNAPDCFRDEVFSVTVYPLQELLIEDGVICVDSESGLTTQSTILVSGLDPSIYTVNWYLNATLMGTGTNYEATEAGTYTVETIKLIPDVGSDCNYAPTQVEVMASSPRAEITFLTEPFDPEANIRIDFIDPGLGAFEYRLNTGAFQASNIFLGIPSGDHTITIRDTSNFCGDITIPFRAIGYPKFFTPNGDGVNDTWNIPHLSNITDATIKIFDRYGKLVKEITPGGEGWNGLSNSGNLLPSSSYWFRVEYTFEGVQRTYVSYFALQRK
ncbi:choice-of-anchor L domain-containing protein [Flavobacteriaceae bacterium S356]|uniref:Choice-of-anchor L domain-containing protein n=1 Tax=Asprobacillus argus TaxID=3076534 RepID=A0ABU3LFQ2_9FLAO|nr:choice-of-anchor L domain-containing protein [Flavobacteriaceae bacterium S356]